MTAEGGKTFSYDSQNHLVAMNSGAVQMLDDGDGNRVAKSVSGVITRYLVDDLNPTGYPQVVDELTSGAVTRTYTYGLQRISQDQVISNTWTPSFYSYDGGGNVRALTNTAGATTDSYEYDAFGNSFTVTGTTPNNYLYRGEQYDSDLGLYYLSARYYNPLTGRFVSRDPNDPGSTDPLGVPVDLRAFHKYLYAGGNPVNWIDPSGRDIVEDALVLENRSLSAVEYLNTIGCFANILITGSTTILSKDLNLDTLYGVGGTVYGCLTTSWAPEGKVGQWVKTGLDLGACALGAKATIDDLNEYLNDPTAVNESKLVLDDVGSVLGCGLTGLGAALEH